MNKSAFVKNLEEWDRFSNNRHLEWRGEKEPYKVWLREIILQQTRVDQGSGYYERFLEKFPDVFSLAAAEEREVFKIWEGLGYYTRCRNLLQTAKVIANEFGGVFPDRYEEILKLKGVGPYSAAAIASFAFDKPYAVVDGNVKRVLTRYFGIEEPVDTTAGKKIIDQLAQSLIDRDKPGAYNQAIIDFGATICIPRHPDCLSCPMNRYCVAYNTGKVDVLPVKSKRINVKERFFNYFVIRTNGKFFIRQRTGKDIWNQLYEFPYVESTRLLKRYEIMKLPELKQLIHQDKSLEVESISVVCRQRLTHQLVNAQFIHLRISKKVISFMGSEAMETSEVEKRAFPKLVADYLEPLILQNSSYKRL